MSLLIFGDTIVSASDIVEIEEKTITFSVKHTKKNPKPKPSGFFASLGYSDTITTYKDESFMCLILKVKGGVQMRGKVSESGSVSMHSNQLYDFYTICNNKKVIKLLQEDINEGNTDKICEFGNYFVYFGMLCYDNYLKTNTLIDESIKSKKDFVDKYLF